MGTMDLPETIEITRDGDVVHVQLGGNLTDASDLSDIAKLEAKHVILDLAALGRMTSQGVRRWMEMLEALCTRIDSVHIRNATHGFVQPYAMIQGFAASARVDSICATYACERCGAQETVVLERERDFPQGSLQPAITPSCARCKTPMVGDDLLFEMELSF
jgi:hypothetical protein